MEVQAPDFPSWVVLDQRFRFEDRRSFRADDETSAEAVATTGELVRVAFTLHPLPGFSGLRLYCPEEREASFYDTIVAAHGDAVLFRYVVDSCGLSRLQMSAMDYFLYRAGTSGPMLSLLPRCYPTEDEVMVAAASDRRTKPRMWNEFTIGLLTAGEGFVVAELEFDRCVDSDAPLEAELFRFCSRPSQGEAGGKWELCRAQSPDLQYKAFPVKDVAPSGPGDNGDRYLELFRTVCVTQEESQETMMFITVDSSPTCSCKRGSDFTIVVWK